MAILSSLDTKTIDELQELGKLSGSEKTIVSISNESRKVSIDTIIGYAARVLANTPVTSSIPNSNTLGGQSIVFIPEGEEISISERVPGCFYLEEKKQTSIRTKINIPTSVTVSKNLGLRRV